MFSDEILLRLQYFYPRLSPFPRTTNRSLQNYLKIENFKLKKKSFERKTLRALKNSVIFVIFQFKNIREIFQQFNS